MGATVTIYEDEILYRVVDQYDVKGYPDLVVQQLERVEAHGDRRYIMLLTGGTRKQRDAARAHLNRQLTENGREPLPFVDEDDVRGMFVKGNEDGNALL